MFTRSMLSSVIRKTTDFVQLEIVHTAPTKQMSMCYSHEFEMLLTDIAPSPKFEVSRVTAITLSNKRPSYHEWMNCKISLDL